MKNGAGGRLAQSLIVGCPGLEIDRLSQKLIAEYGVGGIILFAANYASPFQLWKLTRQLQDCARQAGQPPLFIMADQEGGSVARLKAPFTHEKDFCAFGQCREEELYDYGLIIGQELRAAGINWNLAPVADVSPRSGGIMARRSLGCDPGRVGQLAAAYSKGLQAAGCLACGKHFPGLGRAALDTHQTEVSVDLCREELEANELQPFRCLIRAGVDGIMVGHARFRALDPDHPASLSRLLIEELLRASCGFSGLVLTDDLGMGAVPLSPARAALLAYQAGADLLLLCLTAEQAPATLDLLGQQYEQGRISEERIQSSHSRIMQVKSRLRDSGSYEQLREILNGRE
jgi:beta-N-acetylhexosaminidase